VDEYVDRIYGDNYMEIVYQELDHANIRPIEKIVCKVMERDPGQAIRAELPRHPGAVEPL
jgi:hypothetical protein